MLAAWLRGGESLNQVETEHCPVHSRGVPSRNEGQHLVNKQHTKWTVQGRVIIKYTSKEMVYLQTEKQTYKVQLGQTKASFPWRHLCW